MFQVMRGLNSFIADIRNCPNKEKEVQRCEKELSSIRQQFETQKGLSGYDRQKYIWKLLYMFILGYEIDFGFEESFYLINSNKFSEKYTGYAAISLLSVEQNQDLYKTIVSSVLTDLQSKNEINCSLALTMIGTLAPEELVIQLHKDIIQIALQDGKNSLFVRKKAILCLLRIYKKYKDKFEVLQWVKPIINIFEGKFFSQGYLNSACALVIGVTQLTGPVFQEVIPKVIKALQKLIISGESTADYLYYQTPNPWLQVRLLKILSLYEAPSDPSDISNIIEILRHILKHTQVTGNVNKNNADHGILFEATKLITHYQNHMPSDLINEVLQMLGIFLSVREPNIRYLALDTICTFHQSPQAEKILDSHLGTVLAILRDKDISIKRRALDILYLMCGQKLSKVVVQSMLDYTDEADIVFKEEFVLKIAILAEKFADDTQWYVDVVIQLVTNAGDFVTDDIWFRIIQIITGFGKNSSVELHKYASLRIYNQLILPNVHESLVKIGAYILAEYSKYLIQQQIEPQKLFDCLNKHFQNCSNSGKAMILTSLVKLGSQYPDILDQSIAVLHLNLEHSDPEIQQRAVEYVALFESDPELINKVFERMPNFSENLQQNNSLIKRIFAMKSQESSKIVDQTIQNQNQKQAEQAVEQFMTSSQISKVSIQNNKASTDIFKELKNNPLFDSCSEYISENQTQLAEPIFEDVTKEFKNLLTQQNGMLYMDDNFIINYKSEFESAVGRIALQFQAKEDIQEISTLIVNDQGFIWKMQPTTYNGQQAILVIQLLCKSPDQTLPLLNAKIQLSSNTYKIKFNLPVFTNKFITPQEMQKNNKKFQEITKQSQTYKIDQFIKNPAPPNVPLSDVFKKISSLCQQGLLMNVQQENDDQSQILTANGFYLFNIRKFQWKEQNNIQSEQVLIQFQCFESDKRFLRFSLRSNQEPIIQNLYQILMIYLK